MEEWIIGSRVFERPAARVGKIVDVTEEAVIVEYDEERLTYNIKGMRPVNMSQIAWIAPYRGILKTNHERQMLSETLHGYDYEKFTLPQLKKIKRLIDELEAEKH